MSPATSNGTYGFTYYARNCYDTLVVRENGEFKAGLAETWDISDDGLTYTFHLKEGVKFSDGADLNAEAVKTSLEAAFSNLGVYIASFGKIGTLTESIEVVDETYRGNSSYHSLLWCFERPRHVQPNGNRIAQCV